MRAIRMLALTMLLMLLIGGAYVAWWIVDTPNSLFAPLPTATVAGPPPASKSSSPDLMEVRLHYCYGSRTYALLALPSDATFRMGVGTANASVAATATSVAQVPITGSAGQTPTPVVVPRNATVSPAACEEAGTIDDRKLVLCSSQGPTRLTLTVRASTGSGMYVLNLATCQAQASATIPTRREPRNPTATP